MEKSPSSCSILSMEANIAVFRSVFDLALRFRSSARLSIRSRVESSRWTPTELRVGEDSCAMGENKYYLSLPPPPVRDNPPPAWGSQCKVSIIKILMGSVPSFLLSYGRGRDQGITAHTNSRAGIEDDGALGWFFLHKYRGGSHPSCRFHVQHRPREQTDETKKKPNNSRLYE